MLDARDIHQAFAERVPYHSYDRMYQYWWKRQLAGENDITWPGRAPYYAVTSGTTSNEGKRIPVTEAMLDSIRMTGIKQVLALANFDLPGDFYEKEVLMLAAPPIWRTGAVTWRER
jgi:hypothetical protein